MLNRSPRRGEVIIYQQPGNDPVEYIVMGRFKGDPDILNIATPEQWKNNKGQGEGNHTQVIWDFPEGPNPWLKFKED